MPFSFFNLNTLSFTPQITVAFAILSVSERFSKCKTSINLGAIFNVFSFRFSKSIPIH